MTFSENNVLHTADVCIIGGGMSGICAAVAAARHGASVVLMHDRPVLGGNASSEIRMWIRGAAGLENRETGIVQEIEFENIYRNPTMNYSLWDGVLYQTVKNEKNIELLLNCSCLGCEKEGDNISKIMGWKLDSYCFHTVEAEIFIDCSGDGILAPLCQAPFRCGREGAEEFDEYGANALPDEKTMGSSVLLQLRQTDHPCTFIPPEWAYSYPDDESMHLHSHEVTASGTNFWWIEVSDGFNTINDAQRIQEEVVKIAYGVLDHLKNHGDHGLDHYELEWMGFLPGKRESRRYEGAYMLSQKDLEEGHHFPDAVAFGGWTMDNHSPLGFYHHGYSSRHIAVKVPYEIPLRCLYSRAVPNLMFAGRNISASHMAMSSTRVMATCSLLGQAAGTCAAISVKHGCLPEQTDRLHIDELQQTLLTDGCYIPNVMRRIMPPMPTGLDVSRVEILRNGWDRPHNGESNTVSVLPEEEISFELDENSGRTLRIVWDSDFSRESISSVKAYRTYALRAHITGETEPVKMPKNMMRSCKITICCADGRAETKRIDNNRLITLLLPLSAEAVRVKISDLRSWSDEAVQLFACDIV